MSERQNDHLSPDDYESWELSPPGLSPRSALYQIRPQGIGTAETECLTSYLARIANAHCLPVGVFLQRYLIPLINNDRARSGKSLRPCKSLYGVRYANGSDTLAADLVGMIEKLVLITGIAPMTFALWSGIVPRRELLRKYRSWCANCYAEQAAGGGPIYDLLMWAVFSVNICPRHRCLLIEKCPGCWKQIPPILANYLPGFCPYCRTWLGAQDASSVSIVVPANINDLDYQLWIADNIGDVIAYSPTLPTKPIRQNVVDAFNHCINQAAEGNASILERWLNVSSGQSWRWADGDTIPAIKILLKLSYLIRVPLLKLLMDPSYVLEHISKYPIDVRGNSKRPIRRLRRRNTLAFLKAQQDLEAALIEIPPPSLTEIALRLGYQEANTLRIKFPELSKKIANNYMSSERQRAKILANRNEKPDRERQRKLLEQELSKPCPESVMKVAIKLGYTRGAVITRLFPDLSQALQEKRKQYIQERLIEDLNYCRIILENALSEEPPPQLISVVKQLESGRHNESFLRTYFPTECRSISVRYEEHRKKWLLDAKECLRQSLLDNPPKSLNQISKEIGYSPVSIASHFPDLCRAVVERYKSYRRDLAAKKLGQ